MPVISIVGSCKNEEDNINELYSQISQLFDNELKSQNLELIFIDNASTAVSYTHLTLPTIYSV